MEVSNQLHAPVALSPEKSPLYPRMWLWIDPKVGLDAVTKRKFLTVAGD
jgi:hypothetical protein